MTAEPGATIVCPDCGQAQSTDARFCGQCGRGFADTCAACGADLAPDVRFCTSCGEPVLSTAATEAVPVRAAAPTERLAPVAAAAPTEQVGPATDAPRPAPRADRPFLDARPAIVAAAALVVGAAFLPWFAVPGAASDAFGVPLALAWDRLAPPDGTALAVVVLPLAGLGLLAALVPRLSALRRLLGLLLVALTVAVTVQFAIELDAIGTLGTLVAQLGAGLVLTLVGGVVLAFGAR